MYAPLALKFVYNQYLFSMADVLFSVLLPDKYQSILCYLGLHRNRNRKLVRSPEVP
jgi:hypothetical protein